MKHVIEVVVESLNDAYYAYAVHENEKYFLGSVAANLFKSGDEFAFFMKERMLKYFGDSATEVNPQVIRRVDPSMEGEFDEEKAKTAEVVLAKLLNEYAEALKPVYREDEVAVIVLSKTPSGKGSIFANFAHSELTVRILQSAAEDISEELTKEGKCQSH